MNDQIFATATEVEGSITSSDTLTEATKEVHHTTRDPNEFPTLEGLEKFITVQNFLNAVDDSLQIGTLKMLLFIATETYEERSVTPSQIRNALDITLPKISRDLKYWVAQGYLSMEISNSDRRQRFVTITESGFKFLSEIF